MQHVKVWVTPRKPKNVMTQTDSSKEHCQRNSLARRGVVEKQTKLSSPLRREEEEGKNRQGKTKANEQHLTLSSVPTHRAYPSELCPQGPSPSICARAQRSEKQASQQKQTHKGGEREMLEEEEPPMKTLAGAQQEEERKGATASPRWNKYLSSPPPLLFSLSSTHNRAHLAPLQKLLLAFPQDARLQRRCVVAGHRLRVVPQPLPFSASCVGPCLKPSYASRPRQPCTPIHRCCHSRSLLFFLFLLHTHCCCCCQGVPKTRPEVVPAQDAAFAWGGRQRGQASSGSHDCFCATGKRWSQ